MLKIIFLILLALPVCSFALPSARLTAKQVVTELPKSAKRSLKTAFSKESVGPWLWIGGTTAVTYKYDEEMLADAKRLGRKWDIPEDDKTESKLKLAGQDILRLPTDRGSALYFLGDGWMHTAVGGGFLATGKLTDSTRPINTGYEIFHGMFLSTIFNQALKRSFGRESPKQSSEPRGKWRPFPNPRKYSANTEKYDAMPSGHIMTATMTFTVIAGNYPEYKWWIYPLQAVWSTALAFQMMNNGVHWASDYPLGIAMGFLYGHTALHMGETENTEELETHAKVTYYPSFTEQGPLLNAAYYF
jgi:hypothetical protein